MTLESKDFDHSLHCKSDIGKLNYLAGLTRVDIQYAAVHASAKFSSNPKKEHEDVEDNYEVHRMFMWFYTPTKIMHLKFMLMSFLLGNG